MGCRCSEWRWTRRGSGPADGRDGRPGGWSGRGRHGCWLRRQGEDPLRAAVALRGSRAERDLVRAAEELCPRVRDLCLSVQTGGGELERYLHRQYGVALRPDWAGVQAAIRFDPRAEEAGQAVLSLFGPEADLAGLAVSVPGLERQKEGQWLPLLEILWETGRLERTDLEFT